MANMLDWNTLEHKVKGYLDPDNGIDTPQKAFPILMVASILGVSDEEAEDAITDGSMDRGCDAVFIDDRDGKNAIHIFQFKYVNTFDKQGAWFYAAILNGRHGSITQLVAGEGVHNASD